LEVWWQDNRASVTVLSVAAAALIMLGLADPLRQPEPGVFYRVQAVEGALFVERASKQECDALANDPAVICTMLETPAVRTEE
jgi:hypothetical protein